MCTNHVGELERASSVDQDGSGAPRRISPLELIPTEKQGLSLHSGLKLLSFLNLLGGLNPLNLPLDRGVNGHHLDRDSGDGSNEQCQDRAELHGEKRLGK